VYGSEGSLNLHIKIKHNGGNKTDREKLAKTIIVAHMRGQLCQVIDQIDLNLPPGTISKAAKKLGLTGQVEQQVLQMIYEKLQSKQEHAIEKLNGFSKDEQDQQSDFSVDDIPDRRVSFDDPDIEQPKPAMMMVSEAKDEILSQVPEPTLRPTPVIVPVNRPAKSEEQKSVQELSKC